jgi:hypothetical protein
MLALFIALAPIPKGDQLPPITDVMWKTSADRLRTIGLALHNYHDVHGHFPQDVRDAKGKAILSWRIQILPYMEQDELYGKFNLTEPYDSPHNAKLLEQMPDVFAPVRVRPAAGQTWYQGFAGKNCLFASGRNVKIGDIVDGTTTTAMVVEAGQPVPWTKPIDLAYDDANDLPKIGGFFDGHFNALLADGSVVRVRKDADSTRLRNLIRINDGRLVDLNELELPKK